MISPFFARGKFLTTESLTRKYLSLQAIGRRSKPDAGGDIVLYMSQLNISARVCHRILKVSCTMEYLVRRNSISAFG